METNEQMTLEMFNMFDGRNYSESQDNSKTDPAVQDAGFPALVYCIIDIQANHFV